MVVPWRAMDAASRRMRRGRGRCRPGRPSECSSPGPCSTAAPRERTARRRSERPRWSSRRASSSPGRSGRCHFRVSTCAGLAAAVAAAGLVAWSGLTIWWSIAGDRSWDALAKGIVVLAFGVVGLAASALPGRPLRTLALILAGVLGGVLVWALLGKVVPGLGPDDASRVARLKGSIGYWNALALLADAALGLGLWLVVAVRERFGRPAGALLLFGATLVILLTQSRAGVLAGVAVVALALVLSESRLEAALLGLLADRPGRGRRRRGRSRGPRSSRTAVPAPTASPTGRVSALLVVAGAAAVVAARRPSSPSRGSSRRRRRDVVRGLVGATALVAVLGLLGLVLSVGNPVTWAGDQLGGSGEVVNDPGRLGSLETNNRTVWWGEAWQVFRAHPAGRHGRADTFEIARKRFRDNAENVSEPHSVPLQLLADGGRAGASCSAIALVARARGSGSARAVRRLEPAKSARLRWGCSRSRSRSGSTRSSTTTSTSSPSRLRPPSSPRRFSARAGPRARSRSRWLVAGSRRRRGGRRGLGARGAGALDPRRRPRLPSGRRGGPRRGRRLGSARAEPQPALARSALRARHRRLAGGRRSGRGAALRAGDAAPAREPRHLVPARRLPPDSRSATSAAPTSRSTPPTRSIRAAACSRRRARSTSRGPR